MTIFFVGLTGTEDGRTLLNQCPDILLLILGLTQDECEVVAKEAVLALVNLSADEPGATVLVKVAPNNDNVS